MKKILLALVLLVGAAAITWQFRDNFRNLANFRNSEERLKLYGNVDIRGVDLGFRVSGRLSEVCKDEGDSAKTGDLLASIEREPYEYELARAQADQAAAEADLQMKQAGFRVEEIEQARAALEEVRFIAVNAKRVRERHAGLLGGGGTSRQNLEEAEATADEAGQRVILAGAKLKLLESGFRPEETAAASARVVQAQAAVASAAMRLADTELKAPSDGIILTRALEKGAIVQQGSTVFSLSLSNPVWVRVYVHESELGQVPPGCKVLLTTDGRPKQPFHGTVGFVSPRAEFTPKSVETTQLRTSLVYRLRIVVEDADNSLRQGMPVTVEIVPASTPH